MTRTSRAEWVKRVERWRESKLSAEAFAAQLGIKAARLRHWGWKLKQRRPEASQVASQPAVRPPRASSFIELSAALPVDRSPIDIVTPRGYVLRVPPDVDQKLLERVLEVVRPRFASSSARCRRTCAARLMRSHSRRHSCWAKTHVRARCSCSSTSVPRARRCCGGTPTGIACYTSGYIRRSSSCRLRLPVTRGEYASTAARWRRCRQA